MDFPSVHYIIDTYPTSNMSVYISENYLFSIHVISKEACKNNRHMYLLMDIHSMYIQMIKCYS